MNAIALALACIAALVIAALLARHFLFTDTDEPVITEYRHLMRRVVLWQGDVDTYGSGNILDLGPTTITSTPGPGETEERSNLASGGQLPIRRSHRVEIPIAKAQEAEFAEFMARVDGCGDTQALFIGDGSTGAESWAWYEATSITISKPPEDAGGLGRVVVTLQTRVFDAAVWRGDLLSGVPWVGTTPGNETADPNATLRGIAFSGSDYLVSDAGSLSLRTYDTGGNQLDAFEVTQSDVYGVTRGNIWDGSNENVDQLIYANGTTALYFIDPSTRVTTEVQKTTGPLVYALDYISADNELIYGDDSGTITVEPADGTAPTEIDVSGTSTDVFGVAWDGTDLWFTDSVNLYQLTGKTNTVQNTYALSDPVRGIVFEGSGDILGVDEGNDILQDETAINGTFSVLLADLLNVFDLEPNDKPGYEGPLWTVPDGFTVDITGAATGEMSFGDAEIKLVAPIPGSELTLSQSGGGLTGSLTSQDWDGVDIQSASGTDPALLLDDVALSENVWTVEVVATEPNARPTLTPTRVGEALGARPGAIVPDCDTRAATPAWKQ